MKTKENLFWIIITALLVVTLIVSAPKDQPMAIDFEYASRPQYIDYGSVDALKGLTNQSVCIWMKPESNYAFQHLFDINSPIVASVSVIGGYSYMNNNGKIRFLSSFGTGEDTKGGWDSTNSVITAGAENLICITYNNSSTSNDPVLYSNGASVAVTEVQAPSGPLVDYAASPYTKIGIGYTSGVGDPLGTQFDGVIRKIFVLPFIATADQIKNEWDSRGAGGLSRRSVFCPILYGAKGLQAFDGATLAAGNLIVDPCSGATGVPTGSPVGVGETYLSIK